MPASIQPNHLTLAGLCALTPTFLYSGALTAAGFRVGGIAFGTAAASWMSMIGNVPAGSLFAALQCAGTLGVTGLAFSAPLLVLEITIFAVTLYGIKNNRDDLPPNVLAVLDHIESAGLHAKIAIIKASDHVSELYTEENLETAKKYIAKATQAIVVIAENTLEAIEYHLTLIKNHENVDATWKNAENAITIFLESARNAILDANSRLLEINTQENVDLLRKHVENACIHMQQATEATSVSVKSFLTQENVDCFRKNVENTASVFVKNASAGIENAITVTNTHLEASGAHESIDHIKRNTEKAVHDFVDNVRVQAENAFTAASSQENIDLLKNNTEKVFHDLVSNARAQAENTVKAIHDPENVDLVRQRANEVADNARKATEFLMENFKQTFFKKED